MENSEINDKFIIKKTTFNKVMSMILKGIQAFLILLPIVMFVAFVYGIIHHWPQPIVSFLIYGALSIIIGVVIVEFFPKIKGWTPVGYDKMIKDQNMTDEDKIDKIVVNG